MNNRIITSLVIIILKNLYLIRLFTILLKLSIKFKNNLKCLLIICILYNKLIYLFNKIYTLKGLPIIIQL